MTNRFSPNYKDNKQRRSGTTGKYYKWIPGPFEKKNSGLNTYDKLNTNEIQCGGGIDNNVTYVYDVIPMVGKSAYVDCDYVE